LKALSERLQGADAELWQAASVAAQQAAEAQAARRVRIANLQRQIVDLEMDARLEDSLAEPAAAGAAPAMGAMSCAKMRDKYRTEAARLRAEVADWIYSQRRAHRHSREDSTRIASEVPRIAASDPQYPRVIRRLPTPSEKPCRRFLVHSQLALRARLANSRASHLLTKDGT